MINRFAVKLTAGCLVAVGAFGAFFFAFAPADSSVTTDDGAYALEVTALEAGRWDVEYPYAEVDPDGVAMPYRATHTDNGYFTLSKTPVWLKIGQGGRAVAGIPGQRATVVLGAALAVAVTGLLGLRVGGRRVGVLAAVLAGTSPILFNGLQLWAHSMAVAAVGSVVLGLVMAQFDRRLVLGTSLAVLGGAAAAAIRSDGLAVVAAIVAVTAVRALVRRDPKILLSSAIVGIAAVGTHLVSSAYVRSARGAGTLAGAARPRARQWSDPLDGAVQTLFSDVYANDGAYVAILASSLLVGVATFLMRRDRHREATLALVVAGAFWVARVLVFTSDSATGLLGAWPVVVVAVLLFDRERPGEIAWLGMLVPVAALAVVAGQSRVGGGLNWGGRYISTVIPVLSVLVAVALEPMMRERGWRRRAAGGVVAVSVLTCLASVAFDLDYRMRHDRMITKIETAEDGVPVVAGSKVPPMRGWRTYGRVDWLVVPDEADGGAERLREILADVGADRVTLYRVSDEAAEVLAGEPIDTSSDPVTVDLAD